MAVELTIEQAKQKPEAFLYVWADEKAFLRYIDQKHANIIRGKKYNQNKVLRLSADKYGKSYEDYTNAIRQAMIDSYGYTPAQILVKLANGETVAGKNWEAGIYGVGKVSNSFAGTAISVDPNSGKLLNNGVEIEGQTAIFNKKGVSCWSATVDGKKYTSNYRKISKTYSAGQMIDSEGNTYNAFGNAVSSIDSSDFWESIIAAGDKLLNWILSLFGVNQNTELISTENTTPKQQEDGFTTNTSEAGLGTVGIVLLGTAAAGALIYGTGGKSKKSKK